MNIEKIYELGRTVIEIESKMIHRLLPRIDAAFAQACLLLHQCQGRIAVMGVGKSGHIAKKIAATLSSTGNPAFFIHPSEARHGDIGMLTRNDVLLVLSNSGESEEILSLLPTIKNLAIPLIALTGKPQSTLAQAASVNIDVSVDQEACPLGLAPTSSTTAALVMGDALAIVLSQKKNFTEQDFAFSHPGGLLGRRLLLQVGTLMHQHDAIPTVPLQASLKEALLEMTSKKFGMTTVVNEQGQLAGIFTDGDVRRALDKNLPLPSTKIHEVMSLHPKTIPPTLLAADALELMEKHQITQLVVINETMQPIGLIHIHDILRTGITTCRPLPSFA